MKFDKYIIVAFVVIISIGVSLLLSPIEGAAVIPILAFGFILMGRPRILLFLYIGFLSVQPILQNFGSTVIKRTDDLLAALMWGLFFSLLALRKINMDRIKKWWKFALMMIIYAGVSFIFNRGTARGAWQCFAIYLTFIPFFALIANYLKPSDFKPLLIATILFFFLNVILNIGWLLHINPIPNHAWINLAMKGGGSGYVDASVGTFRSCAYVAYFCIFLIFLLFSLYRNINLVGKKWKKRIFFTLLILFIQLFATFTNHAYFFFALAFIPFALFSGTGKKWHFILLGVIAIIGFNILISTNEAFSEAFSKENLEYRYEKLNKSAKVNLFHDLLIKNAKDDSIEWTIGVGPGNGMGPVGKDNLTPFALKMLLNYYQSNDIEELQQMNSITGNTRSVILTLWGDFGLIGFLIFVTIYGVAIKKCFSVIRSPTSSLQKRVIAEALIGILAMLALIGIVEDVLYSVFLGIWIWLLIAFLYIPDETEEKEELLEITEES